MLDIEGLEPVEGNLFSGLDEAANPSMLGFKGACKMTNWRPCKDGSRLEKRDGLATLFNLSAGAAAIYGYETYYDSSGNFCHVAVTGKYIYRKVGAGAWTVIHTYSSSITHPVKIIKAEGKIIIVTEVENKMILPDGTLTNLGIAAPTGTPTFTEAYDSTLLDEDCAVITDWADADAGSGASSQATFDSKSCMRLLTTGAAGDIAKRTRTVSNIGPKYTIEMSLYFDEVGLSANTDYFEIVVYNGRIKFSARIDNSDLYIYSGSAWVSAGMPIEKDKWINFKFFVDSSPEDDKYVEVYKDGVSFGQFYCKETAASNPGFVYVAAYGSSVATDVYMDYIKIGSTASGNLNGGCRYAITYYRGGTWPAESNPIRSSIGTPVFTGTGLNDLTVTGTYTGSKARTIRVKVDTAAATDKISWSEDGGTTWSSVNIPMTSGGFYISHGIFLTFAATTGHTLNDYWTITCSAFTAAPAHQKVSIASIPTSSDTQVTQRRIYRTQPGGSIYYLCAIINDNTSTTFTDNILDLALDVDVIIDPSTGEGLDRYAAPLGELSEWWDDRLWIADTTNNKIYYSDIIHPEYFSTATRYINMSHGEKGDPITGLVGYKTYLYATKNHSISLIRKKLAGYYGKYDVVKDVGNLAPWGMMEIDGLLMMLTHRGWEPFNGENFYSPKDRSFYSRVKTTLATISRLLSKSIVSVHNNNYNEAWLSVPGGGTVIVYNYSFNSFYLFDYSGKTITCLVSVRDENNNIQTVMGTSTGYLYTCDSGTTDAGTAITATLRSGWYRTMIHHQIRSLLVEYFCPTGNTITVDLFSGLDKDSQSTRTLTGATPVSATDRSLRNMIDEEITYDIRGKYSAFQFSNAESVGSDLKISPFVAKIHGTKRKNKVAAPD